jgi:hypothetical protein
MTTRFLSLASIAIALPGCIWGPDCRDEPYARVFDLVDFCAGADGCDLADGVVVPAPADTRPDPSVFTAKLEIGDHRTITFPLDPGRLVLYPNVFVVIEDGLPHGTTADVHLAFDGVPAECQRRGDGPEATYACTPPRGARELSFVYAPEFDSEPVHLTLRVYLQEVIETGSHEVCYV